MTALNPTSSAERSAAKVLASAGSGEAPHAERGCLVHWLGLAAFAGQNNAAQRNEGAGRLLDLLVGTSPDAYPGFSRIPSAPAAGKGGEGEVKETRSDPFRLFSCSANSLLGLPALFKLGKMDMRPEEREFINLRFIFVLRTLQFAVPHAASASASCTYCAFIISAFVKKEAQAARSRAVRGGCSRSLRRVRQQSGVAKTLFTAFRPTPQVKKHEMEKPRVKQ